MFHSTYSPTSVYLNTQRPQTTNKFSLKLITNSVRRMALAKPEPPSDLSLPRYRHELPFQPGVVNELAPNDWRNQPVRIDFNRLKKPQNSYEAFIKDFVKGPDSPYLKLTKGQFIVHMRRLAMERRGLNFPMYYFAGAVLTAWTMNKVLTEYYPDCDRTTRNETQFTYEKLFVPNPFLFKDEKPSDGYRVVTDKFFTLPQERIDQLPQDLQDLYKKNRQSYFETHSFDQHKKDREYLEHYKASADRMKDVMAKHNLSTTEILHIISMCDQTKLAKQTLGDENYVLPNRITNFTELQNIVNKNDRNEEITEDDINKITSNVLREAVTALTGGGTKNVDALVASATTETTNA